MAPPPLLVLGAALLLGPAAAALPSPERNGEWAQAKFDELNHGTGGPLLGNADLSAVIQTSPSADAITWYVTKTDAWDTHDITGLGQVTIGIPSLGGVGGDGDGYNLTQDIGLAEARGAFSRGANQTTVEFSSFVAEENVLVTELTVTTAQPQTVTVSNMVYNLTVGRHGLNAGSAGVAGSGQSEHMWGLRVDSEDVGAGLRQGLPLRMSLVTTVHTDRASSATTVCNSGNDLCDSSPPRNGHAPDHAHCQCIETLQLPSGITTITVLTASSSIFNVRAAGGANGSEVAAAVALLSKKPIPALQSAHRSWWADFWNASSISLPSQPIMEDYYCKQLYLYTQAAIDPRVVCDWWA
jgi:hypothetical protein